MEKKMETTIVLGIISGHYAYWFLEGNKGIYHTGTTYR